MAGPGDFIGLQMLVTTRNPPGQQLKGTVSELQEGAGLTLSNVWCLNTGTWIPRVSIPSANILEIAEVPAASPLAPAEPTPQIPTAPPVAPRNVQQPPSKAGPAFVDPAILAVGKRPGSLSSRTSDTRPHQPNTSEKRDPEPAYVASPIGLPGSGEITPTAALSGSLRGLRLDVPVAAPLESADEETAPELASQQITVAGSQRKKQRKRKPRSGGQEDQGQLTDNLSPAGRGKGWRQTPILQTTASFQPFKSLRKPPSKENGWASEDVTDVQEMGDFDFEGGLAKFDKHTIFEQMRRDDRIDDADRLVSHNRQPRPKPGTAGGKNLHHSENVLDMPSTHNAAKPHKERLVPRETAADFWNSEADDGAINGGERLSDRGLGSRQGSRRSGSKVSTNRRSQSRKASGVAGTPQGLARVTTGVSHYKPHSAKGSRPSSRLSGRAVVDKKKQPPTAAAAAAAAAAVASSQQGLYVLPSNRRVEPVSALQMINLENIAQNEIGLTEEMMTENAGRGIAEVTLTALSDPAIKVRQASTIDPSSNNPPPPQTVVVLAGNNQSGIRALVAARHLRNKNINVLVCVVGVERGELLEGMQKQVRLYKNLGGRVYSKNEFFEHIRKISIPTLTIDTPRTSLSSLANPAPVALIIDALLGLAISFEELRNGEQATVYELIEWANRNEAFVLAVDIPTGIDPSTGKVSVIDGNKLYVKPRYVVAVGAPKRGLLEALVAAENDDGDTVLGAVSAAVNPGDASALLLPDDSVLEWKLYLVDMGLGPAVWKKAGAKMRRGIDFDDKWVLEMRYQGLHVADADDDDAVAGDE